MIGHGVLTAKVAGCLSAELERHCLQVLYDHGGRGAQRGRVTAGVGEYRRENLLAFVDIAVIRGADDLVALVEIEESSAAPKVLFGDAMAALLSERVWFGRDRPLRVGPGALFIIAIRAGEAVPSPGSAPWFSGGWSRHGRL